jgi:hypothetical protein
MLRKAFFVGLSMASLSAMTAFAVDHSHIPPILHISHFQNAPGCDAAKVMPKLRTGAPGVDGQKFAQFSCQQKCRDALFKCHNSCDSSGKGRECKNKCDDASIKCGNNC